MTSYILYSTGDTDCGNENREEYPSLEEAVAATNDYHYLAEVWEDDKVWKLERIKEITRTPTSTHVALVWVEPTNWHKAVFVVREWDGPPKRSQPIVSSISPEAIAHVRKALSETAEARQVIYK